MMIKAMLRKVTGETTWSFLSWHRDRFGLLPTLFNHTRMLCNKRMAIMPNALNEIPVYLRPGTTDQEVFEQIFLQQEYDIELDSVRVIVDAGAHIGLASIFFALKFPDATVIALEPESSNFQLLKKNTRRYSNIIPVQAGLWSRRTRLQIQNLDAATWSFRVAEATDGQGIEALGITDLMSDFNLEHIDLLKIDIEGSELEVLTNSVAWIDSVGALIIELHDRIQPKCSQALETAIGGFSYKRITFGNLEIFTNLKKNAC